MGRHDDDADEGGDCVGGGVCGSGEGDGCYGDDEGEGKCRDRLKSVRLKRERKVKHLL